MMTFSSAFENLGFKSLKIVISMWSLIRPCWVDFFPRINTHVDMAIRATRVGVLCTETLTLKGNPSILSDWNAFDPKNIKVPDPTELFHF